MTSASSVPLVGVATSVISRTSDPVTSSVNFQLAAEVSSLSDTVEKLRANKSRLHNVRRRLHREESKSEVLEEEADVELHELKESQQALLNKHYQKEHQMRKKLVDADSAIACLQDEVELLNKRLSASEKENVALRSEVSSLHADSSDGDIETMAGGTYLPHDRQCCLELLASNVGIFNVRKVINSVLALAGKRADHLPSHGTLSQLYVKGEVKAKIKISPVVVFGVLSRMVVVRGS